MKTNNDKDSAVRRKRTSLALAAIVLAIITLLVIFM